MVDLFPSVSIKVNVMSLQEEEKRRKEEEERLRRELKEAEHYEALLRADEARRRGGVPHLGNTSPYPSSSRDITVIGEKRRRPHHLGLSLTIEDGDRDLFNLGREGGTRDVVGQRILQVC